LKLKINSQVEEESELAKLQSANCGKYFLSEVFTRDRNEPFQVIHRVNAKADEG
jgi:hypothetical protein